MNFPPKEGKPRRKWRKIRIARWYFGGLASAGATLITHPLDLLKVQMQTHRGEHISIMRLVGKVLRHQGIRGFYSGMSAALVRQLTYSMARFGIYEMSKQQVLIKPKVEGEALPFHVSAIMAGMGGFAGGFVGNPADLVNVRMQNDAKLPPEKQRKYRNVFHGLYKVAKYEGVPQLWGGASLTCTRAALMTIGQLTFYDKIKEHLLGTKHFQDDVVTHVTSSLLAGAIATTMTQPVDVLKTRAMNTRAEDFKGNYHLFRKTLKEGPRAFYKGYVPAFLRLAPHTILVFVFLEQLRINFGTIYLY